MSPIEQLRALVDHTAMKVNSEDLRKHHAVLCRQLLEIRERHNITVDDPQFNLHKALIAWNFQCIKVVETTQHLLRATDAVEDDRQAEKALTELLDSISGTP